MVAVLGVIVCFGGFGLLTLVTANVQQCFSCNSLYCGDPYDTTLAVPASCSDVFRNARLYSSKLVLNSANLGAQNNTEDAKVGMDNSDDIETLDTNEVIRQRSHAEFFDIQRKLWEFFNKGEIDQNTEFVCVKALYNNENGQRKTYRGCVPKNTKSISTACDFVNQKVVGGSSSTVYGCYTCNHNMCNSGISLRSSVLALVIGVAMKVVI